MLIAEIIGVGSELLYGETVDTNTAEIARSLRPYAVELRRTLRLADDLRALSAEIGSLLTRARLIVLSGGLGPTPDDVTREAIAAALGETMELDPQVLRGLEELFAQRGWKMPEANRKQAMKIPSATWLPNPRGTAPGWWVRKEGLDLIALPGPPAEWRPMWQRVLPQLGLPSRAYAQKTFKTFGLGESLITEELGELFVRQGQAEVGTYAKAYGVEVVIRGEPAAVERLAQAIRPRLGRAVWGEDDDTLAQVLLRALEAKGATLATIESLTGGLLGSLLTEVPGASRVYLGGVVSYSPEAKVRYGVPREIIERGTVSPECALAMAETVRNTLGATYALATTGVAGPDELEGHPAGTLFVGLAGPAGSSARQHRLPAPSREAVRQRAANAALFMLAEELLGLERPIGGEVRR
jgi:nicotinamide-nucleotide amidase